MSLFRAAWVLAVGAFLLLIFAVPLLVFLNAASGALLGLAIAAGFVVLQLPVFLLIRRWLPRPHSDATGPPADPER